MFEKEFLALNIQKIGHYFHIENVNINQKLISYIFCTFSLFNARYLNARALFETYQEL